jgi:hypothetical protein
MSFAIGEDLGAELAKVHSDSTVSIVSLEAKIKSIEAHAMDVATAGEKHLKGFEDELVRELVELCMWYIHDINHIGGM